MSFDDSFLIIGAPLFLSAHDSQSTAFIEENIQLVRMDVDRFSVVLHVPTRALESAQTEESQGSNGAEEYRDYDHLDSEVP